MSYDRLTFACGSESTSSSGNLKPNSQYSWRTCMVEAVGVPVRSPHEYVMSAWYHGWLCAYHPRECGNCIESAPAEITGVTCTPKCIQRCKCRCTEVCGSRFQHTGTLGMAAGAMHEETQSTKSQGLVQRPIYARRASCPARLTGGC